MLLIFLVHFSDPSFFAKQNQIAGAANGAHSLPQQHAVLDQVVGSGSTSLLSGSGRATGRIWYARCIFSDHLFVQYSLILLQDFRGVIQRTKAVILVAQAMPELAALDIQECVRKGVSLIPGQCRGTIAFLRVWCLVRFSISSFSELDFVF